MASTSPFGEHLKREREMRGVTLEEVSSATRISTKFLVAIENGQWDQLPGGAFNRGFIRSTSRYLGLDEDGMVAEYSLETKNNGPPHALPRAGAAPARDWRRIGPAVGFLLLLAAGGWVAGSKIIARLRMNLSAAHAAAPLQATDARSMALPSGGPLQLVVRMSAPAEVRVIADGKAAFEGKTAANEEKRFGAQDGFEVSASDSGAVELELNGQPLPKMGTAGQWGRITLTAKDVKSSAGGVH